MLSQVLDREGLYTPCLATLRCHWHLDRASLAIRLW